MTATTSNVFGVFSSKSNILLYGPFKNLDTAQAVADNMDYECDNTGETFYVYEYSSSYDRACMK
jgi:hypothetical protein